MTITSEVAELVLMMLAQNGDVVNETFFESGITFLGNDDTLYKAFVKVSPKQTYTREYSIFSVNDIYSDDPDMTYFDLIRSIPNIMHPGPTFAVPLTAIKMLPSDDILVQFPNNRSFIFQSSSYVIGSEVLITTDNKEFQDEVEGNLRIRSTNHGDKFNSRSSRELMSLTHNIEISTLIRELFSNLKVLSFLILTAMLQPILKGFLLLMAP
jgi:hypothetical protein